MSNDKINYKIIDFNGSYNNLLTLIKKTGDKNKTAKACNMYSKLHRLETGLKKQMEKIEKLLNEDNMMDTSSEELDPNYSETENDTSSNNIEVKF